ncbi:ROK family transcriptional regulator [Bowmanella pacifica]|uniref:Sugar kinase n=1 Tax=Bowmanella pacifica TaxID=502051 RepID=A0A917YUU8_9ALTE|nr:ROK family transcriptional regulator [Bowmanella pacifica]GGO67304.1 sugar kinase [Bowmanella pacifica]
MKNIELAELIPSHIAVLREIHRQGSATRVDLAESTGLSPQSLTRLTKELLNKGLIVEGERRQKQRGQPAIFLSIKPSKLISIGLVIEHDAITCTAKELGGEQLVFLKKQGNFEQAAFAIEQVNLMLNAVIAQCPDDAYGLGIGVSIPGFFDKQNEVWRLICWLDTEGWKQVNLDTFLDASATFPVYIENDGRSAAIGQAVEGVGRNVGSFFQLLMTKGIGGGFVKQGKLLRGSNGNAGEFGFFSTNSDPETIQYYQPTTECLDHYLQEKWGKPLATADLNKALHEQEPHLQHWLNRAVSHIEPGLNAIIALLDPQAIILAGRLPLVIRQELSKRVRLSGVTYGQYRAPLPQIIVAPEQDSLILGASTLPVARYFYAE